MASKAKKIKEETFSQSTFFKSGKWTVPGIQKLPWTHQDYNQSYVVVRGNDIRIRQEITYSLEGHIQNAIKLLVDIQKEHPDSYINIEIDYGYDGTSTNVYVYSWREMTPEEHDLVEQMRVIHIKVQNDLAAQQKEAELKHAKEILAKYGES